MLLGEARLSQDMRGLNHPETCGEHAMPCIDLSPRLPPLTQPHSPGLVPRWFRGQRTFATCLPCSRNVALVRLLSWLALDVQATARLAAAEQATMVTPVGLTAASSKDSHRIAQQLRRDERSCRRCPPGRPTARRRHNWSAEETSTHAAARPDCALQKAGQRQGGTIREAAGMWGAGSGGGGDSGSHWAQAAEAWEPPQQHADRSLVSAGHTGGPQGAAGAPRGAHRAWPPAQP